MLGTKVPWCQGDDAMEVRQNPSGLPPESSSDLKRIFLTLHSGFTSKMFMSASEGAIYRTGHNVAGSYPPSTVK